MKNLLFLLGLLCVATASAQNAGSGSTSTPVPGTASTPAPTPDEVPLEYFRAAQMGKLAVPGAPGNGRYFPPVPADPKLPTLWLIGDSTVRNGTLGDGVGNMNQWGWGAPLTYYFDIKKVNVVNRAYGGTSARSFYEGFFWKNLQPQIKKGDFVILQFGANDNGGADLRGTGDETQEVTDRSGQPATLHTFGWYLKQFVKETRAQGGTCIICSLTPRKNWVDEQHFRRDNTTHAAWAAEAAKEVNAPFIDLYELIARKYESVGRAQVDLYYMPTPEVAAQTGGRPEGLHTGWDGAVVNAECVLSGLKALKDCPLAGMFSTRGKAVKPAPAECVANNAASGESADAVKSTAAKPADAAVKN